MVAPNRDVLVIGGGISGLTVAWRLKQAGIDVGLLEASTHVGGCTRTEREGGFLLERGPFNVMVRDPAFEALLEDFADSIHVVSASEASKKRYIYRGGQLHEVPTNPIALMTTGLLSPGARARLILGLVRSKKPRESEETIRQVVSRRFGREVADTIVSAAINGILAGDIDKLSLAACFPAVARIDAEMRSPIVYGLRKMLSRSRARATRHRRKWRGLISIDGGLGALMEALAARLGDRCQTQCRIRSVQPLPNSDDGRSTQRGGGGFEVRFAKGESESGSDERTTTTINCRRLVLALPVDEVARVLADPVPEAASAIEPIRSASLVVLNLGYRSKDVGHSLRGFGFLVPRNEPEMPLMGALWADSVFPHHAPDGHRLIRVFIGGARDAGVVDLGDSELLTRAMEALRGLLQITGEPKLVNMIRHRAAIPQYHLGHQARIGEFRSAIAPYGGLFAVGNYLEGASLNDCVRVATRCADELIGSSDNGRFEGAPTGRKGALCHA